MTGANLQTVLLPCNKENLALLTIVISDKVKVIDRISAIILW